jgi:hypothetical protein
MVRVTIFPIKIKSAMPEPGSTSPSIKQGRRGKTMMTCKVRETRPDTTEVALYRDDRKWVGVYSWNRGGCLFATTVKFRNLATGEYKEISTSQIIGDNVGDTNAYYAGLWEKHLGTKGTPA